MSVIVVVAILLVSVIPSVASNDSEASSDDWTCEVTIYNTTISTQYTHNGTRVTDPDPVRGNNGQASSGDWAFDEETGYGPFGSFYAAFDPANGNKMVCHLNPYDLTESVDGETNVSGTDYNVMWCLPTVWIGVKDIVKEGDVEVGSTLVMSNVKFDGAEAPAHTVATGGIETTYRYLGIGVYEAYADGGKLYSRPNVLPTTSVYDYETYEVQKVSLQDFIDYAKASGADDGRSMLWNFYQYQLYRFCSLAVMQNFDSQLQIGNGIVASDKTITGTTCMEGPYYGTTGDSTTAEKLFIENAWGNVSEYIGDAYWYAEGQEESYRGEETRLWVGQTSEQSIGDISVLEKTNLTGGFSFKYGTYPYFTDLCTWGLPTTASETWSTEAPDYIFCEVSGWELIVGGFFGITQGAGLTHLDRDSGIGDDSSCGARLAMVFDTDPTTMSTMHHVIYDTQGGSVEAPAQQDVNEGDTFYVAQYSGTKDGFVFGGWSDGEGVYQPGMAIVMGMRDIRLTAQWIGADSICRVTFDLDGGTWDLGMEAIAGRGMYTVPDVVPIKSGHMFKGWSHGNVVVGSGKVILLDSDVTLKAVWSTDLIPIFPEEEEPIEVVIDENGESWSGKNGRSILLIAIVVTIIAELAVLCISGKR